MAQVPFTPLIIDGQERPASNSESFEVHKPQSGALVGTAASATSQDCLDAIDAASRALKTWETSSLVERRDIFIEAAGLFTSEKYSKLLQETSSDEMGFASYWGMLDARVARNNLLAQLACMEKLRGEFFPSASVPGVQAFVQRRAKGVIFAIAPWNSPAGLTVRAIAVAIFCGNTVVFKGSELTPRTHYIVAKIFHEAGLPKGVLNCISASAPNTPALVAKIIAHPQIRHINFTGSDRVGKIIAMEAAKVLKPCVLELGGKAPTIVLEDADLKEAARAIAYGAMANSGQVCMSTERVIVHESVAESLVASIKEIVATLKAGDTSTDPSCQLGPLFSERSAERIVGVLKNSQDAGAQVLLGDLTRDKAVLQPHILTGVKPGMSLWDEESFGPVVVIATFKTDEEAIELGNASTYSLTSSVWSADLSKAQRIAFQLRYGTVNINGSTIHSEPTDGLIGLTFLEVVKTTGELTEKQEQWARLPIVSMLPIVGSVSTHIIRQQMKKGKHKDVANVINTWNHHFFHPRHIEIVLMQGVARLSGIDKHSQNEPTMGWSGESLIQRPPDSDSTSKGKGKAKEEEDTTYRLYIRPLPSRT
ncbi:Salicylaldehyde dehydrogenase [Leucoagaricus sp. SymC.cos]|nr:Salicylaldehyde dehydrogenase [Leucoagaricus sp. SymC.cos]